MQPVRKKKKKSFLLLVLLLLLARASGDSESENPETENGERKKRTLGVFLKTWWSKKHMASYEITRMVKPPLRIAGFFKKSLDITLPTIHTPNNDARLIWRRHDQMDNHDEVSSYAVFFKFYLFGRPFEYNLKPTHTLQIVKLENDGARNSELFVILWSNLYMHVLSLSLFQER